MFKLKIFVKNIREQLFEVSFPLAFSDHFFSRTIRNQEGYSMACRSANPNSATSRSRLTSTKLMGVPQEVSEGHPAYTPDDPIAVDLAGYLPLFPTLLLGDHRGIAPTTATYALRSSAPLLLRSSALSPLLPLCPSAPYWTLPIISSSLLRSASTSLISGTG